MTIHAIVISGLMLLAFSIPARSQLLVHHQSPPYVEPDRTSTFEFRIPGINTDHIHEAYFHYRYQGENAYRQHQASIKDQRIIADVLLSGHSSTTAEYYLTIEYHGGEIYTWPDPTSRSGPVAVEIVSVQNPGKAKTDSRTGHIQYSILGPEPDEHVRPDDFFMGITLFYEYAEAEVEVDSFHIRLNQEDITASAEISPYLITYVPLEKLAPGDYTLDLVYNSPEGMTIEIANWDFQIASRGIAVADAPFMEEQGPTDQLISSGQYQATARSQSYTDQTTHLFRNNIQISGKQGNVNYTLSAMLTTQEDPRLQPMNRYAAQIHAGNWLTLEAGHVYPSMNPYLIAGRRIHGIHSNLRLLSENLQLQFLYGTLNRDVVPLYHDIIREERILGQDIRGDDIVETSYLLQSQSGGAGTYARDIMGARFGIGNGRPFAWSVSAIRVEDVTNSIGVIKSYEDIPFDMMMSLDPIHRQELQNNPDLLNIRAGDPSPQGNFALASDLRIHAHNNRIRLHSDFAASLVNNDISEGILDKNRADDLGFDLDENIESLLDQLSWLIVINENMNALPLKIKDEEADIFVPMGIFATRSGLHLNYFNHNALVQYQWVGPDFSSLANTGQRRDIAGYSISDRFRVFSNTLYLTLGHENLRDNVINNREATTKSITNRVNLGWYPRSPRLPRITTGVRRRTRDNEFIRINPFLPEELENASVRNVDIVDGNPVVLPSPRNNITMQYSASLSQRFYLFNLNHDADLNYTRMTTDDRVSRYGDFTSNVYSFTLSSSFPVMPVRTNLGFNLNRTESTSGLTNLDVFGFITGITWYFLDDRIRFTSELAMTFDRSESVPLVDRIHEDFSGPASHEIYYRYYTPDSNTVIEEETVSYLFSGGLRYRIFQRHTLHVLANYTRLSDRHTALNIPDNHLVQMRYVFDFL